jgi:hypothetical protein
MRKSAWKMKTIPVNVHDVFTQQMTRFENSALAAQQLGGYYHDIHKAIQKQRLYSGRFKLVYVEATNKALLKRKRDEAMDTMTGIDDTLSSTLKMRKLMGMRMRLHNVPRTSSSMYTPRKTALAGNVKPIPSSTKQRGTTGVVITKQHPKDKAVNAAILPICL